MYVIGSSSTNRDVEAMAEGPAVVGETDFTVLLECDVGFLSINNRECGHQSELLKLRAYPIGDNGMERREYLTEQLKNMRQC